MTTTTTTTTTTGSARERPLSFATWTVRAILAGLKTETRRLERFPGDGGTRELDRVELLGVREGVATYRTWRSECEREALAYLDRTEKAQIPAVRAYVRDQYGAAGAGPLGRWIGGAS